MAAWPRSSGLPWQRAGALPFGQPGGRGAWAEALWIPSLAHRSAASRPGLLRAAPPPGKLAPPVAPWESDVPKTVVPAQRSSSSRTHPARQLLSWGRQSSPCLVHQSSHILPLVPLPLPLRNPPPTRARSIPAHLPKLFSNRDCLSFF
jgi:hypothetical protein